ncbi:MAG: hypothetical protein JXB88_20270 [Spirochaetales bacterium]|nr:hypothetical protein [Spirochaetales bacterium]
MHKLTFFLLLFLILFSYQVAFSGSADIGSIKIEHNKENRVYFRVHDMVVYGMKSKYIHVEFWLSQNAQWINSSAIILDPQEVYYDPSYWNGEAYWFYYGYQEFSSYGDPYSPFWGSFFVIDHATNTVIAQKDIEFSLPDNVLGSGDSSEYFSHDDFTSADETSTEETSDDSATYSDDDYYMASHSWYYLKKYYKSDFQVGKNDYQKSVNERDTFQPQRGHAEDNGEYITLWDIDFNEFYSDLYGYLHQQNSGRLKQVKEVLQAYRDQNSLGYAEFAGFVITCIQYTTYKLPEKLWGIYTPLEVIASKTGDCDSRSVLLYSILKDFGYETAIFYSDYYQHAMLGIAYVGTGDYLSSGGVKYYFVETTATGWEIGDLPPDWSNKDHWVILFPILR